MEIKKPKESRDIRAILPRPLKFFVGQWNLVLVLVIILFFAFVGLLSR